MWAAFHGHLDIVKILVDKGANVNVRDNNGWTALLVAEVYDKQDVAEFLEQHGANLLWSLVIWILSKFGPPGTVICGLIGLFSVLSLIILAWLKYKTKKTPAAVRIWPSVHNKRKEKPMKNCEIILFKVPVMCLLVGILGMLIAIYLRIPSPTPTFGDRYRTRQIKDESARREARRDIRMRSPLVYVTDVGGTVEVDNHYGPLEVEIVNAPLKVEIDE